LFTDRDEIRNFYRGPSIDASFQVSSVLVSGWSISKKSSALQQLSQMNQNLVGSYCGMSSIKIADFVPIG
jgi:hypothetical protein